MNSFVETNPQPDDQLELIADGTRRRLPVALLDGSERDAPIRLNGSEGSTAAASPIEVRHVHLPKLEDRGYVSWNQERGEVTRGPQFDEIEPLLAVLYENVGELPHELL